MSRPVLAAAVLMVATLAGCVGSTQQDPAPVATDPVAGPAALPADFVDPMVTNHDHSDASLHKFAWRMKELYHHPLGGNMLKSSGAHAVDVQNGWLFVAAYGATVDVSGGVYIYSLRNPEKPEYKFVYRWPGSLGGDRSMEVTDDGNWIVLGTEAFDCAGNVSPAGPGLYLIDFRDKERGPVLADYVPTSGTHSLTIHRVKNADYVYASTSSAGGNVLRIDVVSPKPELTPMGTWAATHDSAAFDDPLTGMPILYTAGGGSLKAYDINDPGKPSLLGTWSLERDEAAQHYVHAIAMQIVEGKRIVIVESEDWRQRPSPLWILDATDFENIERIGNWTNPGNKAANAGVGSGTAVLGNFGGQLIFSTHNPRAENGLVYLSHYHGGLWVLNISSYAKAENPEILGYYVPHNDNGGYRPRSGEAAYPKPNALCGFELTQLPLVFDAEVQNGIAYMADIHTGLYAVKLDPPPT